MYPAGSAYPLRNLWDAAVRSYCLKLTCRGCRRARTIHAAAVWYHFGRKGWPDRLREVPKRFRCRVCDRRGPRLDLVHDAPDDTSLPLPPEHEWRREQRRRR